jgi:hypothetical protein
VEIGKYITPPNNFPTHAWYGLLKKNEKLNIAISCSGNIQHDIKYGNRRPIPLLHFEELISVANLYLVQKELRNEDEVCLRRNPEIVFLGDFINDFQDTSKIIENMDGVISVDTSLCHLAGAMGLPTFILLPHAADWRWFLNDIKSPWYPSVTLFRQSQFGDWEGVIKKVKQELPQINLIDKS